METNLLPDHEQKLDYLAIELFDYVDEIKIIKDLFEALPARQGIASPYLNFRDAMFHYKKMYDAALNSNDYSFIQQLTCVEEHLNRGLKDFAIHLCNNYYIIIMHNVISFLERQKKTKATKELRKIYHNMKNLVVEIRLAGQTLEHYNDNNNTWLPKMVDTIKAFDDLLGKNPSIKQLYHQYSTNVLVKA